MSYYLEPGFLSFCKGFWNDTTKQFEKGTSADVIDCCLKSCDKYIEDNGMYKSKEFLQACNDACLEYPSKGVERVQSCVKTVGCDQYDSSCIESKRNEILACCKKNCIPVAEDSCTDCEGFYEILLNNLKNFSPIPFNQPTPVGKKFPYMIVIVIFVVFLLIILKIYN